MLRWEKDRCLKEVAEQARHTEAPSLQSWLPPKSESPRDLG